MTADNQADNLKNVFNEIAPRWYNRFHWTRFTSELTVLAARWQKGRLVNLGCGHGSEFLPFKDGFELYGVDFSSGMLVQARRYATKFKFTAQLAEADIRHLPYPDEYFNWAVSVATFHHLKGPEEIRRALVELNRVLKPEGEVFITFWNRWQPRFWFKGREMLVAWRKDDKILKRYYYLLSYREAEKLARSAGFILLDSKPESNHRFRLKCLSRNICLLLKKPS